MSGHGYPGQQQVPQQIRPAAPPLQEHLTAVLHCAYTGAYNASLQYYAKNWPSMMANISTHVQAVSQPDQTKIFAKLSSIEELVALEVANLNVGARTVGELSSEIKALNTKVEGITRSAGTANEPSSSQYQRDLRDINHSIIQLTDLVKSTVEKLWHESSKARWGRESRFVVFAE
ncbi:hypothetical protein ACHAPU_010894 [Fusarium lateritium]